MVIRKVGGVFLNHPEPRFQAKETVDSWKLFCDTSVSSPPGKGESGGVLGGDEAVRVLPGLAPVTRHSFSHQKKDIGQKSKNR